MGTIVVSLMGDQIKKMGCIYTMEYYSAMRKDETPSGTTWMDPDGIALSEIRQMKKDKNHAISLICENQATNE